MIEQRRIILVVGKTGYGKSYYVKKEIIPCLNRYVIFDLINDRVEPYSELADIVFTDIYAYRDYMIEHLNSDILKVVVRFESVSEYEYCLEIAHFAEHTAVIIEEMWNFASPHYYTPMLENLIRFGRHTSTTIVGISHRLGDMGALLINNADAIVAFNLTDRNDINRFAELSYVGAAGAEKIANLKPFNHLLFVNI